MNHTSKEIDEAFDYCAKITSAHYENFPVASLFLPQEKRPYIQAIYAFARTADDFSDEGVLTCDERLQKLGEWNEQLELCFQHQSTNPIFIALQETVERLQLPKELFSDLLTAFTMDVTKDRFATFDELLFYCKHSANPVGRLILLVFGYRDEELFTFSDNICTALQLANFWQDVSIDIQKNRIYIPQEDLKTFSVTEDDIFNKRNTNNFSQVMKFQVERTKQLFNNGTELLERVDKDLRLELRLVWFGGMRIVRKVEKSGYNPLIRRPKLNTTDKFVIFLQSLFTKNFYSNPDSPSRWD